MSCVTHPFSFLFFTVSVIRLEHHKALDLNMEIVLPKTCQAVYGSSYIDLKLKELEASMGTVQCERHSRSVLLCARNDADHLFPVHGAVLVQSSASMNKQSVADSAKKHTPPKIKKTCVLLRYAYLHVLVCAERTAETK